MLSERTVSPWGGAGQRDEGCGGGGVLSGSLPGRKNVLLFTRVTLMRSDSRVHNALLSRAIKMSPDTHTHTHTLSMSPSWDQPAARTTIHGFDPESNI